MSFEKKPITVNYFGLDFLRAIAIIVVYFFHNLVLFPHPHWLESVAKFGWIGVDLFFVLSGFLISSQLFAKVVAGQEISITEFFVKRFFRIMPVFFVVLGLYFSFPVLRENPSLAPLWKFMTFTQNLGLDRTTQSGFSHAWSLCVEEQFYLFFPLIFCALVKLNALKNSFILLLALFIFGFFARNYAWNNEVLPFMGTESFGTHWYEWIYYPTYARMDGLLAGISIGALFQFKPHLKNYLNAYGNGILGLGLIVLSVAYLVCLEDKTFTMALFGFTLVDLGCGLLVLGAVCSSSILYRFNSLFFSKIAGLSYAIYLIHKITLHVSQEYLFSEFTSRDSNLMLFLAILTTVLASLLLNILVEKPFMRLRNKFLVKPI